MPTDAKPAQAEVHTATNTPTMLAGTLSKTRSQDVPARESEPEPRTRARATHATASKGVCDGANTGRVKSAT